MPLEKMPVALTEEERSMRAREAARLHCLADEREEHKKELTKELGDEIKTLRTEATAARALARTAPRAANEDRFPSSLPEVVEASVRADEARNAATRSKPRALSLDNVLCAAGMFPAEAYQTPHHEAMRRLRADLARETDVEVRELREIADARCGDPNGRAVALEFELT